MARLMERRLFSTPMTTTPAWGSARVGSDVAQTAVQGQEETSLAGSGREHYPILTPSKPFIGHGVHVVPQGAQRLGG
jgi:hypothetical protein